MEFVKIEELYISAAGDLRDKENFPGHFLYKKTEIENMLTRFAPKAGGICLEIGCGNGFQSALLSLLYRKVIATDLYHFDRATHTMGMTTAKDLNLRLGRQNVAFSASSAETLAFKKDCFDLVFINSALEHVEDKQKTMREIYRVLVPGGSVVMGVPNFMTDVFLFFHMYLYAAKKVFEAVKAKFFSSRRRSNYAFTDSVRDSSGRGLARMWSSFKRNYPEFPFPQPHGAWRDKRGNLSFFKEIRNSLPGKWKAMVEDARLKVVDTFALLFIPFPVFEPFSTKLWIRMHDALKNIHFRICGSVLKYVSVTYCLIATKKE